jgi:hypothetical protein
MTIQYSDLLNGWRVLSVRIQAEINGLEWFRTRYKVHNPRALQADINVRRANLDLLQSHIQWLLYQLSL